MRTEVLEADGRTAHDAGPVLPDEPVQTYRSRGARVRHVLLIAVGWLAFGWLWVRALEQPGAAEDLRAMVTLVAALVGLVAVVTCAWVQHNVALARRRGGRRSGGPVPGRPEHDRLGRPLVVDVEALRAGLVVVDVVAGTKTFRVGVGVDA